MWGEAIRSNKDKLSSLAVVKVMLPALTYHARHGFWSLLLQLFPFSFYKPCEKLLSAQDLWLSGIQLLRKESAPLVCTACREQGKCSPWGRQAARNQLRLTAEPTFTFLLCFPHCQLQALKANENGLETQFHRRTKHLLIHFTFRLLSETVNCINCVFSVLLP